jgi:hypothetical protein
VGCESGNWARSSFVERGDTMDRLVYSVLICLAGCAAAVAQDAPVPQPSPVLDLGAMADLPLERVELRGGKTLEGLILSASNGNVTIQTVNRRPGQPMHLIRYDYPQESVAKTIRLPADEHARLEQLVEQFNSQAGLPEKERAEMEQLMLDPGGGDGALWIYEGPWFRLESWTDEKLTRKAILQIEQIFAAYSQILPARAKPQRPLRVLLYGSMREYRTFQEGLEYRFQNPAVYIPNLNLLAAGSELSAYARRLTEVERHHAAIRAQYDQLAAAMPAELKKLADDLEKSGVPPAVRRNTRLAAERKWKEELADLNRRLQAIERNNNNQFRGVTADMFSRLYHEAFHAYVENFVYPQDRFEVPRWLNEGLAQVFEDGLLEMGTLRLDAPNRNRLEALQRDLRRPAPLSLAQLLRADGRAFLVSHVLNSNTSEQHYLYSWGLAHYLAVREPVLEKSRLDLYVDNRLGVSDPVARFEQLIGMPIAQFEAKWRADVLAAKPAGN